MAGKEPRVLRSSSTSGTPTPCEVAPTSCDVTHKSCDSDECKGTTVETIGCYLCHSNFHRECINMDKKFFDTLRSKKYSAFWHCCNCTGDSNTQPISITPNLSDLISEMRDKLKGELYSEIKKEIDELSGLIQQKFDKLLVKEKSSDTNSHLDTDKNNAQQPVTHTILINSENEGETCFSKDSWTEVVKNNIQPQLKSIPVSKAVRSKEGKGVLFFPTKELRNEAALKLKDTFKLEKQDRKLKFLSPKLKISWIPKQYFDEIDKKSLKQSILAKNSNIS